MFFDQICLIRPDRVIIIISRMPNNIMQTAI
jgi:hypothetical protein